MPKMTREMFALTVSLLNKEEKRLKHERDLGNDEDLDLVRTTLRYLTEKDVIARLVEG